MGKRASFCLWACELVKAECSVGYFEFLMRRVAVAVIPSPMAAIPASAIALAGIARVRELAGGRICLLAAARVRLLGGAW